VTDFGELGGGRSGAKNDRWFSLAASCLFASAGIWRPPDDGRRAYAFLTFEANPIVAPIHPKAMPVMLQPEDYCRWLDGEVADACSLAQPFPSQVIRVAWRRTNYGIMRSMLIPKMRNP
jgi:putative SOS response-associated peptidase YedK